MHTNTGKLFSSTLVLCNNLRGECEQLERWMWTTREVNVNNSRGECETTREMNVNNLRGDCEQLERWMWKTREVNVEQLERWMWTTREVNVNNLREVNVNNLRGECEQLGRWMWKGLKCYMHSFMPCSCLPELPYMSMRRERTERQVDLRANTEPGYRLLNIHSVNHTRKLCKN